MTRDEQAKLNEVRDLLNLINERQEVMKDVSLKDIDTHLLVLNGTVLKNTIRGIENEQKIKGVTTSLGMFKWIIGLEFLMLTAIIGLLVWLI